MKRTQLKVKHGGYTFQNLFLHFHCNYASSFCKLTTWPCVNCSIAVSFAAFMQFPTCDVFQPLVYHWTWGYDFFAVTTCWNYCYVRLLLFQHWNSNLSYTCWEFNNQQVWRLCCFLNTRGPMISVLISCSMLIRLPFRIFSGQVRCSPHSSTYFLLYGHCSSKWFIFSTSKHLPNILLSVMPKCFIFVPQHISTCINLSSFVL